MPRATVSICLLVFTLAGYSIAMQWDREGAESALEQARTLANSKLPVADAIAELGAGWIAEEALAIAVYCALVAETLEEGVVYAVNHSGDSDSTGAIAGNPARGEIGCGGWPTLAPSSEQEIAVVNETELASSRHKVHVRAEITDKVAGNDGRAGWYQAGVAYFVRSEINQYPVERMRELAVHEVCHASDSFHHDMKHWCCMKLDGEIGYPPPVTVMGQWPTCEPIGGFNGSS